MILDELAIPGLSYEILEGDTRIGGRVYTHHFPLPPKPDNVPDYKPNEKHQYYDVCLFFSSDLRILPSIANHHFRSAQCDFLGLRSWKSKPDITCRLTSNIKAELS